MVCLVINGKTLPGEERLVESLLEIEGMISISISSNRERTNVIMGKEIRLLYGKEQIEDEIDGITFKISPLSFYQVNPVQTERIYSKALEYADLNGEETVWDLYCGIGTISLFLARKAKQVYGVEIVPEAIADAKENALRNNIKNVSFYVGKAEEVLPEKYEKEGIFADVIVVDPPRKGCDEACLSTMVRMQPKRIVYVSCDSATLARDVKYLRENGYEIRKARAFDNFPQSVHVETVAILTRKNLEVIKLKLTCQ
jgi:23S rRNA (uracil1939-C5)-methyltransferase